jgi:hypothetical protein
VQVILTVIVAREKFLVQLVHHLGPFHHHSFPVLSINLSIDCQIVTTDAICNVTYRWEILGKQDGTEIF